MVRIRSKLYSVFSVKLCCTCAKFACIVPLCIMVHLHRWHRQGQCCDSLLSLRKLHHECVGHTNMLTRVHYNCVLPSFWKKFVLNVLLTSLQHYIRQIKRLVTERIPPADPEDKLGTVDALEKTVELVLC